MAIEARSGARTDVTRFVRVGDELALKTRAADPQHLAEEGDRWFAFRLGDEAKRTHPISSRAKKAAAYLRISS